MSINNIPLRICVCVRVFSILQALQRLLCTLLLLANKQHKYWKYLTDYLAPTRAKAFERDSSAKCHSVACQELNSFKTLVLTSLWPVKSNTSFNSKVGTDHFLAAIKQHLLSRDDGSLCNYGICWLQSFSCAAYLWSYHLINNNYLGWATVVGDCVECFLKHLGGKLQRTCVGWKYCVCVSVIPLSGIY